jgi:sphinganine-1-phosphate aldolase
MEKRGFFVEKQLNPESLHMTIMPQHYPVMDALIKAIRESVEEMKQNPNQYETGSKAMYGMVAKIPDENLTEDFVIHYMDQVYKYR